MVKLRTARASGNWQHALKWYGRMEELMEGRADDDCDFILDVPAPPLQHLSRLLAHLERESEREREGDGDGKGGKGEGGSERDQSGFKVRR